MDKADGSAKQAGGAVKKAVGAVTGDAKLKAEGTADKVAGKIQNAAGGVKDAIRDTAKDYLTLIGKPRRPISQPEPFSPIGLK